MINPQPGDLILTKYRFHINDLVTTVVNTAIVVWQFFFLMFYCWRRPLTFRQVLTGCTYTHVRLCVDKNGDSTWRYINQTSPALRYDYIDPKAIEIDKDISYLQLALVPSANFSYMLKRYADNKVAQKYSLGYDYLQLVSILVNSVLFWWLPKCHGREIIKMFNIRGGHEICSSLVVSMIRFADLAARELQRLEYMPTSAAAINNPSRAYYNTAVDPNKVLYARLTSDSYFLSGYDSAMVSPCLFYAEAMEGGFYEQKI